MEQPYYFGHFGAVKNLWSVHLWGKMVQRVQLKGICGLDRPRRRTCLHRRWPTVRAGTKRGEAMVWVVKERDKWSG